MSQRRRTLSITPAGLIFSGITAFVLVAAINSGTNLLFFAFGLMLGALLVSGMVSAIMLRKVDVERLTADHGVIGQFNEVQYRVTNGKRRWPSFALRLGESRVRAPLSVEPDGYCLHLGPRESGLVMTHLSAARRGVVELAECRVSCAFPFGFLRSAVHVAHPQRVAFYPRIGTLSREVAMRYREAALVGGVGSGLRGGHDEFFGLREYRAGDNVRAIHWRRTARTGELLIREMTTDAPPQVVVAVNLRTWRNHDDGPAQVERAIELAAALVCHGFLQNYAVGLSIAGAPGADLAEPRTGRDVRARMLEILATLDAEAIIDVPGNLFHHRPAATSHWMLVTLYQTDPWADLVPQGAEVTVMALDQPGSEIWLQFPKPAVGSSDVLKGGEMGVVDRKSEETGNES